MPEWIITSAASVLLTLTVTLLFNKFVSIPKSLKKQKAAAELREKQLKHENEARDLKIASLESSINSLIAYKAQSQQVQTNLENADKDILNICNEIKNSMLDNRTILNDRLDRLEKREKNAIRAKLLDEYRLFTDETKNPMLAWSEMEHHAFFELVKDYEDLNGNDYVHSTVIPAMNSLAVILMSDKQSLLELMNSRKL